ncbi:MAG: 30S ribosomal protein S20 [Gammaproteobacteria bacterium]|nr:MAG: 30S ribosomal protein S20 [Gammaproteobacteria bacterium]
MANSKSAEKRARQAIKRRASNVTQRSRVRGAVRKVVAAVESGNQPEAAAALKEATPVIDAMARKGILHRNKAARHKSRLARRVKALTPAGS